MEENSTAMSIFARLAEAKIDDAMRRGEFDDLPGAGKPLELEDLSHVPAHMRLGYKVLRNANVLPPEVELRREMYSLDRLIETTSDAEDREELRRRRRESELRYNLLVERRTGGIGRSARRWRQPARRFV
jgi:DnaJ-like protein